MNLNLTPGNRTFLPGARRQNFLDLLQREVALLFAVVKVRREAHARLGSIIHQNLAREQFAADFAGVGTIDGHPAGTVSIDCPHAREVCRELLAREILVDYRSEEHTSE